MNISYVYVYMYIHTSTHVGQPVAWCLSDHESSEIIQAFLSSIKAKSPSTCVKVMMTDDGTARKCLMTIIKIIATTILDNTGWSAAQSVFGDVKHLLCRWHVDRYVVLIFMY